MIKIDNKQLCSGCAACANICPVDAIYMIPDQDGFLFPQVNMDLCIKCNKCMHVCPFLNPGLSEEPVETYIAEHKSKEVVQKSSSGGVAYQLARYIFQNDGWFFGAAFDSEWNLKHDGISSINDLEPYRRSKYVQSDIGYSFRKVKKLSESGKPVVFIGTPCQVAGLRNFLGKRDDSTILVEVVCHAVASPSLFKTYLNLLKRQYNSEVDSVNFRDKELAAVALGIYFKNGMRYLRLPQNDLFFRTYGRGLSFRESCGACLANNFRSGADLQIGDFWGARKKYTKFNEEFGTSLIIVRSSNGEKVWNAISAEFKSEKADLKYAQLYNPNITISPKISPRRDKFFNDILSSNNVIKVMKKFTKRNYLKIAFSILKRIISSKWM